MPPRGELPAHAGGLMPTEIEQGRLATEAGRRQAEADLKQQKLAGVQETLDTVRRIKGSDHVLAAALIQWAGSTSGVAEHDGKRYAVPVNLRSIHGDADVAHPRGRGPGAGGAKMGDVPDMTAPRPAVASGVLRSPRVRIVLAEDDVVPV
jgi:hypothetical protein